MAEVKSRSGQPLTAVCRCCLATGCYKDISSEYFWMGKREVYAEMLKNTFDLSITVSPKSRQRLICDACISRLRDAADFKMQVEECDKSFVQYLEAVEESDGDVKEEKHDACDYDDTAGVDDDDTAGVDDDDMDDQPLTNFMSNKVKEEPTDLIELLESATTSEATIKRKKSSITLVPSKKMKIEIKKKKKQKVVKAANVPKVQVEKKNKEDNGALSSETPSIAYTARRNADLILQFVTAYPFRIPGTSLVCVYCIDSFEEPAEFRAHMQKDHPKVNLKMAYHHTQKALDVLLKTDCTDLNCRICLAHFDTLTSAAKHLKEKHNKNLNLSADIALQEFRLGQELWVCAICSMKLPCLRRLCRHTNTHYHKYTCESCGKSYAQRDALNRHVAIGHRADKMCAKCKMFFPDCDSRREHLLVSKSCWQHVCGVCGQRFMTRKLKQDHLESDHGLMPKSHKCPDCDKVFDRSEAYRSHFVIEHTDNSFSCPSCDLKFDRKRDLEEHKVVHTKETPYVCPVCGKAFSRRKYLRQHSWIHNEHKRFECKPCNKQFNQRVSWKTHMKSYHPEFVNF